MSWEHILKIEFSWNLFMRIQEQVQSFAEIIYAIKRASTSPCFSVISIFLLNASCEIEI